MLPLGHSPGARPSAQKFARDPRQGALTYRAITRFVDVTYILEQLPVPDSVPLARKGR